MESPVIFFTKVMRSLTSRRLYKIAHLGREYSEFHYFKPSPSYWGRALSASADKFASLPSAINIHTARGAEAACGSKIAGSQPAVIAHPLIGMAAEQGRHFGLDSLRQQRSRAVAQNLGQRIGKSPSGGKGRGGCVASSALMMRGPRHLLFGLHRGAGRGPWLLRPRDALKICQDRAPFAPDPMA
jgi:hypothetical protein